MNTMTGRQIRYFRKRCGMTQKCLGKMVGFSEKNADVRVAQYETGARMPKATRIDLFAKAFHISPYSLTVPNMDSGVGLMHTLFALEDHYGIYVENTGQGVCLRLSACANDNVKELQKMISLWGKQAHRLRTNEITQEQYDEWRYNFPNKEVEV